MRKFSALFAVILVFITLAPSVYAAEYDYGDIDMEYYTRFKGQNLTLNVFNWGEYISDGTDDSMDINKAFEELTGINVVYSTYDTNESLYAKLKLGGVSFDVIIPSDYMIDRMIKEGMLQEINKDNVPNIKYIDPKFKNNAYDPKDMYSVPYTWGTVGIIYNKDLIDKNDAVDSWSIMWSEAYRNNILMFGNPKDAFGIAFKILGYPINAESEKQIEEAAELLKQQKPILQAYVMDEIFDKMTGQEAAIAPYYAGDAITMIDENPSLDFVIPKEGSNIFIDAMCIPTTAKNKELAEMYINFMLEPKIGLENIRYIGYSTANTAVYDILDEDIKNNPIAYPDDETLVNCEFFYHVDEGLLKLMDEKWTEVLATDDSYNRMLMPVILVVGIIFSIALNLSRAIKKAKLSNYAGH